MQGEERDLTSTGMLSKHLQWFELGQAEARSLKLPLGLWYRYRVHAFGSVRSAPGRWAGSWILNRSAGTQTSTCVGCWHYKWIWMNLYLALQKHWTLLWPITVAPWVNQHLQHGHPIWMSVWIPAALFLIQLLNAPGKAAEMTQVFGHRHPGGTRWSSWFQHGPIPWQLLAAIWRVNQRWQLSLSLPLLSLTLPLK